MRKRQLGRPKAGAKRPANSPAKSRPTGHVKDRAKRAAKRAAVVEAQPADVVDSLVAAGAKALGLPLDPAWRAGVKFNLALILRLAALVDEFPLAEDTEPGPVFHA
jgi:hypothetical protein